MSESIQDKIDQMVKQDKVVLFMKGTPAAPQCGFSNRVSKVLQQWEVPYQSYDVLSDPDIRQGIKTYASWPTIPQLYVGGEFIGGCDIVLELSDNGELKDVLGKAFPNQEFTPPPPPAELKQVSPQDAKKLLDDNSNARLLDFRSPEEYELVHLEQADLVTHALVDQILDTWAKDTPIVCICHHGVRSAKAGYFLLEQNFLDVTTVSGGIDAWAMDLDDSLARY